ncbi:unnamed protein product [Boreogadus saida]
MYTVRSTNRSPVDAFPSGRFQQHMSGNTRGVLPVTFQSCELNSPLVPTVVMLGGGAGKGVGEDPDKSPERGERGGPQSVSGAGFCKWFNVRMGFGFISMTSSEGSLVEPPLDVFVHQDKSEGEGEGEEEFNLEEDTMGGRKEKEETGSCMEAVAGRSGKHGEGGLGRLGE